ncbi:DUF6783 domain-containing protein [uncultured Robinsoniella sp.]|uniref:DUF6783 domain-containing protein n=1 Tax=Robinsoniella sp. TaxID=2496533 RepID=UPI00374E707B
MCGKDTAAWDVQKVRMIFQTRSYAFYYVKQDTKSRDLLKVIEPYRFPCTVLLVKRLF